MPTLERVADPLREINPLFPIPHNTNFPDPIFEIKFTAAEKDFPKLFFSFLRASISVFITWYAIYNFFHLDEKPILNQLN